MKDQETTEEMPEKAPLPFPKGTRKTASLLHQRLNAVAGPGRGSHRSTMHGQRHAYTDRVHRQPDHPVLRGFMQQINPPSPGPSEPTLQHHTATPKWISKARRRAANKVARRSRKVNAR